jgi:ubiquitin carboxyl-terminal hydrolase 16/45
MVISKEKDDGSTDSGEEFERGRAGGDDINKTASKCSHIVKSIETTKLKKLIKANGIQAKCLECEKQKCLPLNDDDEGEYDTTLWLCLRCGIQLCGRRCNKHALDHYEVI